MSYQDDNEVADVQVWNNAAFDNEDSDFSWSKMQDVHMSQSSDCSKENICPSLLKTPVSVKYSAPVKPLNPNGIIGNSQRKPLKTPAKVMYEKEIRKERNIDAEIKETEKEISRLSTKLKALQIEKAEQSRRKSCVSKFQGINEERVTKRKGKSTSLSPKSRRTLSKVQGVKKPATIAVSKRSVKKSGVLELIHPKKLFMDVEKSAKPLQQSGKIVASRYSENPEECCKGRASPEFYRSKGPETRVKKRWEIPSEIVFYQQDVSSASKMRSGAATQLIRG